MTNVDDLIQTLRAHPDGMTVAELLVHHPQLTRRTAQRWLGQLVGQGRIAARGQARSRRYLSITGETPDAATRRPLWPDAIPLSADSRDILAHVDRPLQARTPVGYDLDFLAGYRPNATYYLPASLRRRLHALGRTAHADAPAGTYGRAVLDRLLIDLSWASSHLEGNTYSRLDTRELIERGRVAQGKDALETQMILNHKAAIELLVENIGSARFDRYTLMNLHSALAENLMPNPADEGRIRSHAVEIASSVYRPPSVPAQIESAFDMLLDKAGRIIDPFEQSFFVMVQLPYLQPFADVNKRTSRLAANLPLIRSNLCPLTFLDVPEPAYTQALLGVYEMTRVELLRDLYLWAYERSTQEYLVIRRDLAEPEPLRLAWRDLIKRSVREVVLRPDADALAVVDQALFGSVPADDRAELRALVIDELRRLHEGVLARYGLRPSEFAAWRMRQHA